MTEATPGPRYTLVNLLAAVAFFSVAAWLFGVSGRYGGSAIVLGVIVAVVGIGALFDQPLRVLLLVIGLLAATCIVSFIVMGLILSFTDATTR